MLRVGAQGVGAHGGCFQDLKKLKKIYAQGRRTWTCVQASRFFTASFEYRAVDRRLFHQRSPRPAPPAPPLLQHDLHRRLSSKRPPSSRLCVFVLVSSVMCFNLSSCSSLLPSPRLLPYSYVLYSSACSPMTTKRPLVEGAVRPVAPTLRRVVVRLEYLLRHHHPPQRHAA